MKEHNYGNDNIEFSGRVSSYNSPMVLFTNTKIPALFVVVFNVEVREL